jgi:hypothetical protein
VLSLTVHVSDGLVEDAYINLAGNKTYTDAGIFEPAPVELISPVEACVLNVKVHIVVESPTTLELLIVPNDYILPLLHGGRT